jgi:hypothetical protein
MISDSTSSTSFIYLATSHYYLHVVFLFLNQFYVNEDSVAEWQNRSETLDLSPPVGVDSIPPECMRNVATLHAEGWVSLPVCIVHLGSLLLQY